MSIGRIAIGFVPVSVLAMMAYLFFPNWDARQGLFAFAVCLSGLAVILSTLGLAMPSFEHRGAAVGLWSSGGTATWVIAVHAALAPWLVVGLTIAVTLGLLVVSLAVSRSPYPNERFAQSLMAGSLLFALAMITLRVA